MALRVESDESTNIDSYSSKFGTPESLEEVRNLTDIGAMTRLLHECIAYQRGLDLELDTILSHRTDLDKLLSSLQKSAQILDIVKADAEHLCANFQLFVTGKELWGHIDGADPAPIDPTKLGDCHWKRTMGPYRWSRSCPY
ncbi:hypothetical protein P3L10_009228 [Capsicum annuum]